MKKSIVVSTPEAKFSALAYKEDFRDSIRKVAELGFDGVELAIRDPRKVGVDKIKELVRQYNLDVPAIGTGQAWGEERLSFSDPRSKVRKKAIARIKDHIDFAARFSAQVIIGLIRGRIEDHVSREDAEKWTLDCVRECAGVAQGLKVGLTLEPLNRYETNFINTVAEGIEFIKKVDLPNIGMLIDTFHMNIEEVSLHESIVKAKDYINHVHLADSNRWAPGSGHLNFAQIIKTLEEINYKGYLSAEILPLPDPDRAARLTIDYLKKIGF
ncbi:MAG: 5-keto-L-gluconate epimerase [bacterium]